MKIKQVFRLFCLYAKMDLSWLLRDTKSALLAILSDCITGAADVAGVFLLALRFGGVGDLSRYEVLFMLGYAALSAGLFQLLFANCNTGHISRRIGRGQMEHMFLQPLPLPVQLLTEGFIPFTGGGPLCVGAVLLACALRGLNRAPSPLWLALLAGSLLATTLLQLSLSYLFSSAAFYAPVAAEEISSTVLNLSGTMSQYPLSGMPLYVQLPLISILPAGLLAWFPALALLGRPPLGLPGFFFALVALGFSAAAYLAFRKGLTHYVKTGSNRYLSFGHRR